jgi:hypothetical protein
MGRACRTPGDMRDLYNISGGKLVEKWPLRKFGSISKNNIKMKEIRQDSLGPDSCHTRERAVPDLVHTVVDLHLSQKADNFLTNRGVTSSYCTSGFVRKAVTWHWNED